MSDRFFANPRERALKPVAARALVDTGALHLCVPEHVAIQLELDTLEPRDVTTADGRKRLCPCVGPAEVHFDNRVCFTGALVLGDEVLLGAIPMEDLDLVVCPSRPTVTVNPASPNLPFSTVKPLAAADAPARATAIAPGRTSRSAAARR